MAGQSQRDRHGRLTGSAMKRLSGMLLTLVLSPSLVHATWSEPGTDFSGELKLGGEVSNSRNPWIWKAAGESMENLLQKKGQSEGTNRVWKGLFPTTSLLMGKTAFTMPSGRTGLAPQVTLSSGTASAEVVWTDKKNEAKVTVPVTGTGTEQIKAGTLTFTMVSGALMHGMIGGQEAVVALRNDLPGNALPPDVSENILGILQKQFGEAMPEWLHLARKTAGVEPLSTLNSTRYTQTDSVYGLGIAEGSGILSFPAEAVPEAWQVSFTINVVYQ